jgi:hypothetical protein
MLSTNQVYAVSNVLYSRGAGGAMKVNRKPNAWLSYEDNISISFRRRWLIAYLLVPEVA